MKCWHSAAEEPEKWGIKVDHTILLESSMTISKRTKKLSSITKSFFKFVRALTTTMAKPLPTIVSE